MSGEKKSRSIGFRLTPEGTAALFLLRRSSGNYTEEQDRRVLAEILKTYWYGGYDAAKRGDPRE